MKYDTAAPYIACFVLLRDGDRIAFVLRENTAWMNGYYGLPSGKVEWGEPFTIGAIREAKEEVGVDIKPEHLRHALTLHRHSDKTDWVDVFFEVDTWHGEVINAEPNVHSEVTWLDSKNLPDNVVPGVAYAIEQIAAGNNYAEFGWENS
jgi:ADP-ribose pyrophosphatase YjhB (NUDIX family)